MTIGMTAESLSMKIYGDRGSGNCQKVSITADYLEDPLSMDRYRHHQEREPHGSFLEQKPDGTGADRGTG